MKGDTMATTKADPYQDPSYFPPDHKSQAIVKNRIMEGADLALEEQACMKDGSSGPIESFAQGQVDDLLKRAHTQAKADVQEAGRKKSEKEEMHAVK